MNIYRERNVCPNASRYFHPPRLRAKFMSVIGCYRSPQMSLPAILTYCYNVYK